MSNAPDILTRTLQDLLDNVLEAPTRDARLTLLELATLLVSKMEMPPEPEDEKTFLVLRGHTDRKIAAIKALRMCFSSLGLKEAKTLVEVSSMSPVVLCSRDHALAQTVKATLEQNDGIVAWASANELRAPGTRFLDKENLSPNMRPSTWGQ